MTAPELGLYEALMASYSDFRYSENDLDLRDSVGKVITDLFPGRLADVQTGRRVGRDGGETWTFGSKITSSCVAILMTVSAYVCLIGIQHILAESRHRN